MLADPSRSCIVLINPDRCLKSLDCSWSPERVALLNAAHEIFSVTTIVVGDREQTIGALSGSSGTVVALDGDPLLLWRTGWTFPGFDLKDPARIFMGGAWLEEEVLIAALGAGALGYDVCLLNDLSDARRLEDRQLVTDRLQLHTFPTTTLRQAMLEWAACSEDPVKICRVREALG